LEGLRFTIPWRPPKLKQVAVVPRLLARLVGTSALRV
jgi:hypothetical protein